MGNKIHASMPEEESESMKDPKKKMGDWWSNWWVWWDNFKFKNPWGACSLQYGGLFLLFLLVGHILGMLSNMANVDYFRYPLTETFRHPFNATVNLTINKSAEMHTTETYAAEMYADNARSILCALVASEAAIVAIVVSLTLIAIELTGSAYSPRVIKIALRNPNLTFLLLIYGVAIFSSIILIKQLPYDSMVPTEDVSLAFWFGVFSYVTFVLYFLSTIRLMMPENIIRMLSQDVTKDKILNYIKSSRTSKGVENCSEKSPRQKGNNTKVKSTEDPVQPIVDIIYGSLRIHDLETIRYGLKTILEWIEAINLEEKDQEVLSKYFSVHLRRVGKLAASTADEGSTKEVITTLKKIGEKTVYKQLEDATEEVISDIKAVGEAAMEKGLKDAISEAISSLNDIGNAAAKERLENSVKEVASSLGTVGIAAADKGLEDVTLQTVNSLETVGSSSAESQLGEATLQTALSLKSVGKTAAKKELEAATKQAAESLGAVGKAAAEKGKELEDVTMQVASSLEVVGEAAVKNNLEHATMRVASSLEAIGHAAAKNNLEHATMRVASSLGAVGKIAAENRLEHATMRVALSLGAVGKAAADRGKELEVAVKQTAKSLEEVGKTAAKVELEEATKQAALSLLAVGKAAMENELEAAARQAASALASLSRKEIVETTIHNYELNLRDSDRSSYLKCKMLYEQELEKRK